MPNQLSVEDQIKQALRLLMVTTITLLLVVGLAGGLLIRRSAQGDADRLYADSVASCMRVNLVRSKLDNLYLAFITHNNLTSELFSIVGATIRADDPKVAAAFTKFARHYQHINTRYSRVPSINCRGIIKRP